ncbi:MAG: hypothetical protein ATN33_01280 [Epulopiscium sp. Nele67-Bin001]|nr:MAG: hypothetical protein BEN18_08115 [Epulopiscium sp. Nuni2H_MBin001]OON91397.1 MAG: hypothetical protein ATN33_01280 [Epulopiscium sp. Nele67-Bin001]
MRIDDIQRNGYRIFQNPDVFCFGVDAVLLAHYVKVGRQCERILDIGTGTGIIPILMHAIYQKGKYVGIDIQSDMIDMAKQSVELNNIGNDIAMECMDIKDFRLNFNRESFDVVTCNPPYMKGKAGLKNENYSKTVARHEVACSLEDIVEAASFVLKEKGRLAFIHRAHRLVDILFLMRKYKVEPKRMRMVYPKLSKAPTMVLVEGIKYANAELKVDRPLIVYNEDNTYTDEILEIYGRN